MNVENLTVSRFRKKDGVTSVVAGGSSMKESGSMFEVGRAVR